jgi:hypothetical protein
MPLMASRRRQRRAAAAPIPMFVGFVDLCGLSTGWSTCARDAPCGIQARPLAGLSDANLSRVAERGLPSGVIAVDLHRAVSAAWVAHATGHFALAQGLSC